MFFGLWMLLMLGDSHQPFVLITAERTPIEQISRWELRQIFLKKINKVRKVRLKPIQLRSGNPTRQVFEKYVHGSGFRLSQYWELKRLQGGEKPPLEVAGEAHMLVYIERNPGFLGYVSPTRLPELKGLALKVVILID